VTVATTMAHQDPIYLIRHGETEWSLSGQYTGRTDLPLTAQGEAAARKVGERLKNVSFAHVLVSPLQRARQTCALAALKPTPEIEPDLTARWSGLSVEQAGRLLLDTASISILSYAHDCPDEPAIALWNSAAGESFNPEAVQACGERDNPK